MGSNCKCMKLNWNSQRGGGGMDNCAVPANIHTPPPPNLHIGFTPSPPQLELTLAGADPGISERGGGGVQYCSNL